MASFDTGCSFLFQAIQGPDCATNKLPSDHTTAQELLSQGVHPVVLNCPHRIQWTDSNETWAEAQLNSQRYNRLLTEFAQQPPWRLLNLHALMAACGNECNKDRVHARPPVYDAAVQVLLGMFDHA